MTTSSDPPRVPARRADLRTGGATPERRLWERWLWAWHALFYGLLIWIGACLWLMDRDSGGDPWMAGGGLAAVGAWYGALVVAWPRHRQRPWHRALYLAGALAMWSVLVRHDQLFFVLAWAIAAQTFVLLPLGWAIAGVAAITALVWRQGGVDHFFGLEMLTWFLSLSVVGLVTAWQKAMVRHSEERQGLLEELAAARDELAAAEREAGRLGERQRLAREIHDTVAQEFTSIVLHLEAAEAALADLGVARKHLDQARRTARHGLAEARRLVQALRPELLDGRSLAEALERLARRWSEETGVAAALELDGDGDGRRLPRELEATLLRAAQEALANVRKHAAAERVTLTYSRIGDLAVLDVQDDGRGFAPADADAAGPGGGFGLIAMRERAEKLGGRLLVESAPGEGTTVVVELPVGDAT